MRKIYVGKIDALGRQRPIKDYAGERFGRLTATNLVRVDDKGRHDWAFVCECGTECVKDIKSVRSGHTSSCGCLVRDALIDRNTKHGLSRKYPQTYRTWKDMKARCSNPNDTSYKNYGGRGIKICSRWEDFANFFCDMGPRPDGLTLDRINVNKGYYPENCRWADAETQANNRRGTLWMEMDGRRVSFSQWCRAHGVDRTKARYRIEHGLDPLSDKDFRK